MKMRKKTGDVYYSLTMNACLLNKYSSFKKLFPNFVFDIILQSLCLLFNWFKSMRIVPFEKSFS